MNYRVSWSDGAYPEIVADPDAPLSWAEAKAEIVERSRRIAEHHRMIVRIARTAIRSKVDAGGSIYE